MVALLRWSVRILAIAYFVARVRTTESANLTLFTGPPANVPLVITPLDTTGQLLVSVANDVTVDPPDQLLTGWQFRIHAVPDIGTAGTLSFSSGTEPNNYVLAGVSHPFGPASAPFPGDPTIFTALDTAVPTNAGAQVPPPPGANLLLVSLVPSADALGTFGIYALNSGADSTIWTDATSDPNNHSHDIVNVPRGGPPVYIAKVIVTSVADCNRNGVVDAADYVVWRKELGTTFMQSDYDVWRAHFGQTAGSGGDVSVNAAVPEPSTLALFIVGILAMSSRRRVIVS